MKTCITCERRLSVKAFTKNAARPDGLQSKCRDCQQAVRNERRERICEVQREWYSRNKLSIKKKYKEWYDKNKKEESARARATYKKNHIRRRCVKWGFDVEEVTKLVEASDGNCDICCGVNANGKRLAIDHNHSTGKVRGLLCSLCNTAIGKFKDSPSLLMKAIKYLEKHDA